MGAWLDQRKALLLDLDNTLYDWVAFFAPALRGMCRSLSELTGLPSTILLQELKEIFRKHGTVEYSFALQELPSLRRLHPQHQSADIVEKYRSVIDVFQHRRRVYLRLYPGVSTGIQTLRRAGYLVFGVTDSRQWQAENRLRQLRLDLLLDGLCCVADHAVPDPETVAAIRRKAPDRYKSQLRVVIPLPDGLRKPAPGVLDFVVSALQLSYQSCLYVGDSLSKDVAMAQMAGVYDCWAQYGAKVSALDFSTLVRVTDWPSRAVKDALNPSPERLNIQPSSVATSFDEVVTLALQEPRSRPRRRTMTAPLPRQLSLMEIGPSISESQM